MVANSSQDSFELAEVNLQPEAAQQELSSIIDQCSDFVRSGNTTIKDLDQMVRVQLQKQEGFRHASDIVQSLFNTDTRIVRKALQV